MSLEHLYKASKPEIWQGRVDSGHPEERRWHQVVQTLDVKSTTKANQPSAAILGFRCDEGVRRNKGRPGAKEGPDAFRAAARNLPCHGNMALFDAGDVTCLDQLEAAQEALKEHVCILLNHGYTPLVVGGGHEIAFPHYGGIRKYLPAGVIGIINFDAHFDLRSDISGLGNSGTSFYQIRQHYEKDGNDYFYCPIGIQKNSNTDHLFSRARDWNVEYILAEDVMFDQPGSLARVSNFMNKVDYLYITVCLDVFQSAVAPGVSAPSAAGIGWPNFFPLLRKVFESRKVVSMDIAELNPRYDLDNRTAKLAAAIAFEMVYLMSRGQIE